MNRFLIIGSSMSLPSDELKYEDTWPYLLQNSCGDAEFVINSKRSSSATRLNTEGPNISGYDMLEYYNPNYVITQIGITDAAPRLFKRNAISTKVINRLPFSKLIYNIARKTRGRVLKNCDLSPEEFKSEFTKYVLRAALLNTHVFIIEISRATEKVLKVSPHYNECVDIFNAKLHEVASEHDNVTIIPVLNVTSQMDYQKDGIHHSVNGQRKQFKIILEVLSNKILRCKTMKTKLPS